MFYIEDEEEEEEEDDDASLMALEKALQAADRPPSQRPEVISDEEDATPPLLLPPPAAATARPRVRARIPFSQAIATQAPQVVSDDEDEEALEKYQAMDEPEKETANSSSHDEDGAEDELDVMRKKPRLGDADRLVWTRKKEIPHFAFFFMSYIDFFLGDASIDFVLLQIANESTTCGLESLVVTTEKDVKINIKL